MVRPASHSADVEIWLDCGQYGRIAVSRVTAKSVVTVEPPQDIPPCYARLVVTVDGHQMHDNVNVTSGFSRGRRFARVRSVNGSAPF